MAALMKDRNTRERQGGRRSFPVAASTVIHAGALVAHDGGHLVPASADPDLVVVGRADQHVDNAAGADGDTRCETRTGVFAYENSAGADEITRGDIGSPCYAVDDQTVALTSDTNSRPRAGTIHDVDDDGVWVTIT